MSGTSARSQQTATKARRTNVVVEPPAGDAGTLYEKRQKVYPRAIVGRYEQLRRIAVFVLLGLYYGLAWVQYDGRQAVLFDLPARKFHIFGLSLWPQDLIYLVAMMIVAALALFFFTMVAGRIWCGYACPQTVWTETFVWIERWVEGDRSKRIKLDRAPMSPEKLRKKAIKHSLWILFAAWTGLTFVGYFTPIRELLPNTLALSLGPWETFWVIFYSFATYGNAGWLREQVCFYMCPYARFQSSMFDKNTLIVSYDSQRGEPRGSRRRNATGDEHGLGDCIDCTLCVQVCPTGIDIRDGLQYQCIGCGVCADACDSVMDKMGYAPGLISYTTENTLSGEQVRIFRPRLFLYAGLILAILAAVLVSLQTRSLVDIDVIRDRNALYRATDDGFVENVYTVSLLNKSQAPQRWVLGASGIEGLELISDDAAIMLAAGEVRRSFVTLRVPATAVTSLSQTILFIVTDADSGEVLHEEEARFLGPAR